MSINCSANLPQVRMNDTVRSHTSRVRWDLLTSQQRQEYQANTERELENIKLDHELILCDDIECTSHKHRAAIDTMYNLLIDALHTAARSIAKQTPEQKAFQIPGWNDICASKHAEARDAFLLWKANGKPKQGPMWEFMRTARSQFKYALRQCDKQKSTIKSNKLANHLLEKDTNNFWKHVKNTDKKEYNPPAAETVGGKTGSKEIAEMWRKYFQNLLNSQDKIAPQVANPQEETIERLQC